MISYQMAERLSEPGRDARTAASPFPDSECPAWAAPRVSASLGDGLQASEAAQALFGSAFVEHYANPRIWEERQFDSAAGSWSVISRSFEVEGPSRARHSDGGRTAR
jgi:glutamine synthetase